VTILNVENFEKYKLWSQVNEDFETGTVKSLEDIEFGGEIMVKEQN
jgi:hypothetical protein